MSKSYTTDDLARMLQVSKLTIYDLIKRGDLPAYRVGRQMRVDALDFERFKSRGKDLKAVEKQENLREKSSMIISGQDSSLDILARALEKEIRDKRPLRSYAGSLDSLIAMYHGEADIVSCHLLDGESGEYNLAYVKKLLVNEDFVLIKFINRVAGFYVAKGNPKQIMTWKDLARGDVLITNREKGSGARVLLDEQLRLHKIHKREINGYTDIQTSHLAVASAIKDGRADVGVGIEQVTHLVDIDFIPMITESYDLVMLKNQDNIEVIQKVKSILRDEKFQKELQTLGYNVEDMGKVVWEE